jgi:hypothetical protein
MRLYHFTNTLALVGFHNVDGMTMGDLHDKASPNSIMKAGLRPYHNDSDPEYYPECVWLTTNPEMSSRCLNGLGHSDHGRWRLTVVIPESDRRLVHIPKFHRKRGYVLNFDNATSLTLSERAMCKKESAASYFYRGFIGIDKIRELTDFAERYNAEQAMIAA